MTENKIGKAISFLRKRAGYTQKDLADRIGISDKTVSKWERGLGLPDIGYLRRLSILLDTDTDSLLAGDVVHHDSSWSGIIVLDENGYGIGAGTVIYDKPLIHYLLSYFLLVGIRDVTIAGSAADKRFIDETMADGSEYGIRLRTVEGGLREAAEGNTGASSIMMVYGRCLLYGVDQTRFFQKAMMDCGRFTMLVLPKKINHQSTRISIDHNMKVINSNADEPLRTQYDFSDIPILFFPASLLPDMEREKDISSFVSRFAAEREMYVQMLDRGFVEIEADDWASVHEASEFFRIVQDRCGMNVYCIEEVAWRRGFISLEQLRKLGQRHADNEHGRYILSLIGRIDSQTV